MSDFALVGTPHGAFATPLQLTGSRPALMAEVVTGADGYEALRSDWHRLMAMQSGSTIFQTPELLAAWATIFATTGTVATIVVRNDMRPVLIWPLFVERRGLFRVAIGAGAPIAQYDDVLVDPSIDESAAMDAAIATLRGTLRPDLVLLERVRADSALRRRLAHVAPLSWSEAAPFRDLRAGAIGMDGRQGKLQRKRVRRFAEEGEVGFAVTQDGATAQAWVAEALALKKEWLKSTGRVSRAFLRCETAECLAALAKIDAPGAPRMTVARLTLDGRTAAIEAGFVNGNAFHLYLGAFAPELGKLGPGNVIMERLMQWCAEHGIATFDMMAPRSRNKSEWQSGEVAVVNFALPLTLRGRFYVEALLKRIVPGAKQAFYRLPERLRSAIAGRALQIG